MTTPPTTQQAAFDAWKAGAVTWQEFEHVQAQEVAARGGWCRIHNEPAGLTNNREPVCFFCYEEQRTAGTWEAV